MISNLAISPNEYHTIQGNVVGYWLYRGFLFCSARLVILAHIKKLRVMKVFECLILKAVRPRVGQTDSQVDAWRDNDLVKFKWDRAIE